MAAQLTDNCIVSENLGSKEAIRKWVDDMRFVAEFQHRHLRDGRTPEEKVRQSAQLLDLYLSLGGKIKPDDPEALAERRKRVSTALSRLTP